MVSISTGLDDIHQKREISYTGSLRALTDVTVVGLPMGNSCSCMYVHLYIHWDVG